MLSRRRESPTPPSRRTSNRWFAAIEAERIGGNLSIAPDHHARASAPGCARADLTQFARVLIITAAITLLIDGSRLGWLNWQVTPKHNINLAEAIAWHNNTLELAGSQREAARVDGRLLNAFPPAFTFISYAVLGVTHAATGSWDFPPWAFRVVVGLPLLLLTVWAARTVCGKEWQAIVMAVTVLLATPMLPMLRLCRIGGFFEVNHVLAVCGLLAITGDMLGRRRIWPSALGLALSLLSRQLTMLYLPALILLIWHRPIGLRARAVTIAGLCIIPALGAYLVLNTLKFGSPFDTGYVRIYEGRSDPIAQRARAGLFRPEYMAQNLRYMMFEPPGVKITASGVETAMNDFGASIWLTCPVLIAVPLTLRRWWADQVRRTLMLCSFAIMLMLLMYHNTGWRQPGYYRFCLDFIPVWLLVIGPYLWSRRGTALSLICIGWSVWYFRFITSGSMAWAGIAD